MKTSNIHTAAERNPGRKRIKYISDNVKQNCDVISH
jgi:hypothetical protein